MSARRGALGKLVRPFLSGQLSPLLLAATLLVGALAVSSTPREEDPQIVVPLADVMVQFPGASAAEVERRVARPLEKYLWQIDGVEHVYSMAQRGMAIVTVRFHVGEDRERSLIKLHNRVAMHADRAPPGVAGWVVKPVEIDDVPIVTLALHSATQGPHQLRRLAEELVAGLEDLDDLSRTELVGGASRVVRVRPDPARLAGHGVTLLDLERSLRGADASLDAGSFTRMDRVVEVSAGPFLERAADLEALVVGVHQDRPVLLSEVAAVSDGPGEPDAYTRLGFGPASGRPIDGPERDAVTVAVAKKRGTNAVTVAAAVLARVEALRSELLPGDVEVQVTRNSGATADRKVDELLSSLLFAIVSVVVLVTLAMGWREGLVVAAAVPVSFALSLTVNYLAGYTVNRVTLFALILSLGLVVDDPITNVDNIQRHHRMGGKDPTDATLDAVEEVLPPVLMSTLAIIVTFLPMFFITGMMGPYMAPMAVNVPLAVSFSTVAALTVVPWMAHQLLAGSGPGGDGSTDTIADPTPAWIHAASRRVLGPLLDSRPRRRWLLVLTTLAWFAACALPLARVVPLKMLPFDDKSELQLILDLPEGSTLERTDAVVRSFEALLRQIPEVLDFEAFVGLASPMDFNGLVRHDYLRRGPHLAEVRINLAAKEARTQQSHTLALRLRPALQQMARDEGVTVKLVEVPPGPPVLATLVAEVYPEPGADRAALAQGARELAARMASSEWIVDLDDGLEAPRIRLEFRLDKEKASLHGVSTDQVVRTLRLALGGERVGVLHQPRERSPLEVVLRLDEAERSARERLLDLEVRGAGGALLALAELGELVEQDADPAIMHKDLQEVILVRAETAGRPPGEVVLDLQAGLRERPLAAPVRVEWAGEGEWLITLRVFRDLGIAFGVAMVGIYLLLVLQTGSFGMPLVIMIAIPLTALGVMPGFWILNLVAGGTAGGYPDLVFFTATAMIGMIALGGIVVRNSIVLIEFVTGATLQGAPLREALLDSVAVRLRPIVLTALTTGIGALPITMDPIFSGLAWSLIFGLLASTAFTLVVIPVVYFELRGDEPVGPPPA